MKKNKKVVYHRWQKAKDKVGTIWCNDKQQMYICVDGSKHNLKWQELSFRSRPNIIELKLKRNKDG